VEFGPDWQRPERPTVVALEIDKTPPTQGPTFDVEVNDTSYRITWTGPADIGLVSHKYGRPAETACQDPDGYRPALIPFFSLPRSEAPYLLCAIGFDAAGNPSPIVERLLP
jgi:hypothetical protein